ncbi:ABC transporter ATP-binding protein [Desulfurobacterium sp.]
MGLVVEELVKSFNGKKVLDRFSLFVRRGEFHVLLGPSGEGKSTLLRVIAGLERCDGGKIFIDGRDVTYTLPENRHVGFLFQDFALFPHLTVFENVAFGLKIRGIDEGVVRDRVLRYLDMVGLSAFSDVYPDTLSGGQKQRVALARTLVLNPSVLLLDEPLSHLDPVHREVLLDELLKIHEEEKVTILYVTHDMEEAEMVADRVSVIHNGCIEQTGTPEEIFYAPRTPFVAGFVGVTNIFSGAISSLSSDYAAFGVSEAMFKTVLKVKRYPIFERRRELSLCIHPDKIVVGRRESFNTVEGVVVKVLKRRGFYKLFVDVYGKVIVVNVSGVNYKRGSTVSLFLPPDAFHPLCGKREKAPESERACLRSV